MGSEFAGGGHRPGRHLWIRRRLQSRDRQPHACVDEDRRDLTPFSLQMSGEREQLAEVAGTQWFMDPSTRAVTREPKRSAASPLIEELRSRGHAGLIVFTSGSSGKPKAILHDVERVASKFSTPRKPWRMLLMLLMDHFGGFNTLLSCLFDGGVGVCVGDRSPLNLSGDRGVSCRASAYDADVPWVVDRIGPLEEIRFLFAEARHLRRGAHACVGSAKIAQIVPNAELKQTYGLSELGVLRSSSPDAGSLWLRIGGNGFETRVVDGELHIRSSSSMLGYLNAPSPIDESGWMNTGDLVEQQGDLIRFVGRKSEIINVGGQKVFPTEVESVVLEVEGILDVLVTGCRTVCLEMPSLPEMAIASHPPRGDRRKGARPLSRASAEIQGAAQVRDRRRGIPVRLSIEEGKKQRKDELSGDKTRGCSG